MCNIRLQYMGRDSDRSQNWILVNISRTQFTLQYFFLNVIPIWYCRSQIFKFCHTFKWFVTYFNVLSFLCILMKRHEAYLNIVYLGERHRTTHSLQFLSLGKHEERAPKWKTICAACSHDRWVMWVPRRGHHTDWSAMIKILQKQRQVLA